MIDRFRRAWENPTSQARIVRWFWVLSTAFTLFGFLVILYLLFVTR